MSATFPKKKNYQSAWRPFQTRINPLMICASQQAPNSFANWNDSFNNAYTGQAGRTGVCGATQNNMPVRYHQTQYRFMNTRAAQFPGPVF